MTTDRKRILASVAAVFVSAGALAGPILYLRSEGGLQRFELAVYDHFVRRSSTRGPALDPRVALVAVTEEDIQQLGTWPLPDGALAELIQLLNGLGARAVGIDIYRDMPVPPGSADLDQVLLQSPMVVFPSKFPDEVSAGVGPPPVLAGTGRAGFNNMVVDADGFVRRGMLFMEDADGGVGYSFSLLLALYYLAAEGVHATEDPDDPALMRIGPTTFRPIEATTGSYAGADAGGYQYLIDFRGAAQRLPTVPLRDVFAGRVDPEMFRDRIVVVGVTADSIPDRVNVAFDRGTPGGEAMAGVVLHGHMASQILRYATGEGEPIHALADWQEAALVVAFALLGGALGLLTHSLPRLAAFGVLAAGSIWGATYLAMAEGWWLPALPVAVGCLGSGAAVTAWVTSRERAERAQLMQLFSAHVAKEVADELWKNREVLLKGGRPAPTRCTASILFVDMKGYTAKADKLDPADLMVWLNDYLDHLALDIQGVGGFIDDYFGDGIMAAFGVPIPSTGVEAFERDARDAVAAGLAMGETVTKLNRVWGERGYPTIGIRVGICSGEIVTGSIGSSQRLKFSIVGDVVVTAQRLESLDDSKHDFDAEVVRILVHPQTREYLGDSFAICEFGEHVLKGRVEPVLVHKILTKQVTPASVDAPR